MSTRRYFRAGSFCFFTRGALKELNIVLLPFLYFKNSKDYLSVLWMGKASKPPGFSLWNRGTDRQGEGRGPGGFPEHCPSKKLGSWLPSNTTAAPFCAHPAPGAGGLCGLQGVGESWGKHHGSVANYRAQIQEITALGAFPPHRPAPARGCQGGRGSRAALGTQGDAQPGCSTFWG